MTTPAQPGWYDDPQDSNAQRYWDGQNWTPHRQRKNTTPTTRDPAPLAPPPPPPFPPPPAAGTTRSDGLGPYLDKVRPHVAKGQQFWSGLSRQSKIVFAVVGLVVIVIVFAFSAYLFGSGGPSGHSDAWNQGYQEGKKLGGTPGVNFGGPGLACVTMNGDDWQAGCKAGFADGQAHATQPSGGN
jgi:Protein of unknown function (DUF2510)